MAKFQYSKAITDSFSLVFNNLYVFVPFLLISMHSLLFLPFYFKLLNADGSFNFQLMMNPSFIIFIIIAYISALILNLIGYGWTFALIGQIVKKGKASLIAELKNAPKKALYLFVITLILFLIFMGVFIAFMILMSIFVLLASLSKILGAILIILLTIAFLVSFVLIVLALFYVVPLLALENLGPIKTIKLSFEHFKSNKAHTLALLGIIFLFYIMGILIMYSVLFFVIGSISNVDLVTYMLKNPFKYSLISFFAALPYFVIIMWSFAFLTISYARKKKLKK